MAGSKKKLRKKQATSLEQEPPSSSVDEELMDDLFARLDSRDESVQAQSAVVINEIQSHEAEKNFGRTKQYAKNRFNARQARKAAALEKEFPAPDPGTEARLRKETEDERNDIDKICQEQMLQIHEVTPDGHCLFSAVADQLALLGTLPTSQASYATARQAASQYMLSHPDEFLPFLEQAVDKSSGVMSKTEFEKYCANIRDTAVWGGEPEILALSRAYNIPIHVIQGGSPPVVVHVPGELSSLQETKRVVRISYHRRMYGLGEHYNSLRPRSKISQKIHSMLSA